MTWERPTFALSVEARMADYRDRIAARIRREMELRGERELDVAVAIGTSERTVERWASGETEPQRRFKKPLADHFGLPMDELYPDLEAEEQRVVDQLNRIEDRVDAIARAVAALLSQPGVDLGPPEGELRQELLGESPTREARGAQDNPGSSRERTSA